MLGRVVCLLYILLSSIAAINAADPRYVYGALIPSLAYNPSPSLLMRHDGLPQEVVPDNSHPLDIIREAEPLFDDKYTRNDMASAQSGNSDVILLDADPRSVAGFGFGKKALKFVSSLLNPSKAKISPTKVILKTLKKFIPDEDQIVDTLGSVVSHFVTPNDIPSDEHGENADATDPRSAAARFKSVDEIVGKALNDVIKSKPPQTKPKVPPQNVAPAQPLPDYHTLIPINEAVDTVLKPILSKSRLNPQKNPDELPHEVVPDNSHPLDIIGEAEPLFDDKYTRNDYGRSVYGRLIPINGAMQMRPYGLSQEVVPDNHYPSDIIGEAESIFDENYNRNDFASSPSRKSDLARANIGKSLVSARLGTKGLFSIRDVMKLDNLWFIVMGP